MTEIPVTQSLRPPALTSLIICALLPPSSACSLLLLARTSSFSNTVYAGGPPFARFRKVSRHAPNPAVQKRTSSNCSLHSRPLSLPHKGLNTDAVTSVRPTPTLPTPTSPTHASPGLALTLQSVRRRALFSVFVLSVRIALPVHTRNSEGRCGNDCSEGLWSEG